MGGILIRSRWQFLAKISIKRNQDQMEDADVTFKMWHYGMPHFANERNGSCKLASLFHPQTAFWLRADGGGAGGTCVKARVRPIREEGEDIRRGAFHASTLKFCRDITECDYELDYEYKFL